MDNLLNQPRELPAHFRMRVQHGRLPSVYVSAALNRSGQLVLRTRAFALEFASPSTWAALWSAT